MENKNLNRRTFLKRSLSSIVGTAVLPAFIPASAWSSQNITSPNDRITLGFIGVGKQGFGLLNGFLNTPGTQVLAVCDVDQLKLDRAQAFTNEFYANQAHTGNANSCAAYRNFQEIIARKDIDAVVISTPDHWHAIQAIQAAESGKDIYCEKPLSLTIPEGRAMVKAVRRFNRVFQTGSMQRSDAKFRLACELVQNGYIGTVKSVRVSIRSGFIPHPVPCDLPPEAVPSELDWDLWVGPAPKRPYNAIIAPPISFDGWPAWRNYREFSGGGMADWGAHHFDIAQWGLGMDYGGPVEIIPPNGAEVELLTYIYANGVVLTTDFVGNRILFTGTEGEVEVNREYIQTKPASLVSQKMRPDEIHLYDSNNHKLDWLNSIRQQKKPICDVEIGCRSVSLCHLGNIAAELKRPLKWNPEKERFENDAEANKLLARPNRSPWRI